LPQPEHRRSDAVAKKSDRHHPVQIVRLLQRNIRAGDVRRIAAMVILCIPGGPALDVRIRSEAPAVATPPRALDRITTTSRNLPKR
jgi:hypothetical protein